MLLHRFPSQEYAQTISAHVQQAVESLQIACSLRVWLSRSTPRDVAVILPWLRGLDSHKADLDSPLTCQCKQLLPCHGSRIHMLICHPDMLQAGKSLLAGLDRMHPPTHTPEPGSNPEATNPSPRFSRSFQLLGLAWEGLQEAMLILWDPWGLQEATCWLLPKLSSPTWCLVTCTTWSGSTLAHSSVCSTVSSHAACWVCLELSSRFTSHAVGGPAQRAQQSLCPSSSSSLESVPMCTQGWNVCKALAEVSP